LQYAARRLAETLSGSVKGPKRVPLSFRQHSGIKAQGEPLEVVQDRVGVLYAGAERVVKAQREALEVVQDKVGVL